MSSDETYGSPSGANNSTIEYAENAKVAGVAGKKVFNIDSSGNLVNSATSDNQTNGSQKTQITTSLINFVFDSIYLTEPDTVTEVYTYKLSGNTVATITIIYTDATKEKLVSCIRS